MAALVDYSGVTLGGLVELYESECRLRDEIAKERAELQEKIKVQRAELQAMAAVLRGKDKQVADYQQQLLDAARSTPPLVPMPRNAKEWEPYIKDILRAAMNFHLAS